MTYKVIDVNELEKLKETIDNMIAKKSITSSLKPLQSRVHEYEIYEKDRVIFEYIKNNPGIIKAQVIKFFEKNKTPGYSRGTGLCSNKETRKRTWYDNYTARQNK